MSDLIFAGELQLTDVTDEAIGEELVKYFREHESELPMKVRQAVAQAAVLKDQVNRTIERADAAERAAKFEKWTSLFLDTRKSERTKQAYKDAISRLLAFCNAEGIEPSAIEYDQAVKFTLSAELRDGKRGRRGEQSIRLDIAAVSSLYSELDRMSKGKIKNPFLRLQTKPGKKRASGKEVPSAAEVETILANTGGEVRAAIACMIYRGFRIGALPGLGLATRDGRTRFETLTKGKGQAGEMPQAAMDAIEKAGLSRKKPFEGMPVDNLKMRIQRELDRLASEGLIAGHSVTRLINKKPQARTVSDYSCHSFRHFFAVTEYGRDHDIERVRRLLNHADLNTTQAYLQSLGLLEE